MARSAPPTFADACEGVLADPDGDHAAYTTLAPLQDQLLAYAEGHFESQFEAVRAFGPSEGVAVELGCGVGGLLPFLEGRYRTVVGVDSHPALLAFAARRARESGLVVGDATRPPLPDGVANLVLGFGLASELDSLAPFADAVAALLAPGGTVVCDVLTDDDAVRTEPVSTYRGNGYRVERSVTDRPSEAGATLRIGYRVTEEATGRTATTTETRSVRFDDPEEARDTLTNAGFEDVAVVGPTDGQALVVGHTPD